MSRPPRAAARNVSILISVLLALPVATGLWAWLWMVGMYGRWDLWGVVVHESGLYTLAQTVFFTNHFCREWPVKLVYILASASIFLAYRPLPALSEGRRRAARSLGLAALAATAVLVAAAFAHAAGRTGLPLAASDLFQFRSNDTAPAAWGSHWRFHFLSGIAFIGAAGFLSALSVSALVSPSPLDGREAGDGRSGIRTALTLFAAATIFFLPSLEPFTDPRFLGHQLREATGTDLPVSVPLLIAVFLLWDRWLSRGLPPGRPAADRRPGLRAIAGWAAAAGFPVVLTVALLLGGHDLSGNRPPGAAGWSVPDLYAAHVFEHSLDYLFYLLAGSAVILLAAGRTRQRLPDGSSLPSQQP